MVNTILAKRVNHIVAKGDHPVWPKGSKSHGFSIDSWNGGWKRNIYKTTAIRIFQKSSDTYNSVIA